MQEGRWRRHYIRDRSRIVHQRVKEHKKEIGDGVGSHPMVILFIEEHDGEEQEI